MKETPQTPQGRTPGCGSLPANRHLKTGTWYQHEIPNKIEILRSILPEFHAIRDPDSGTAVFLFGFPNFRLPLELAEIRGYFPETGGAYCCHHGHVLAGQSETPLVLVIRAAPGTLIQMPDPRQTSERASPLFLNVGKDLEIEPTTITGPPTTISRNTMTLWSGQTNAPSRMTLNYNDLRDIFADVNLPLWLRTALDTQLLHWKKHHAETYYQFTPWPVIGEEFARCVKAAPYWALARWKEELFPHQISYCMQRSPEGAVIYCLDRIPQSGRTSLVSRFAASALQHARDQLTDEEIIICAVREPHLALDMRSSFPPTLQVKIYVNVVPMLKIPVERLSTDLETDILESIALFPSVWIGHYGSFAKAMDSLAIHLSILPNRVTMLKIHQRMNPDGKKAFLEFIVSRTNYFTLER